jgi:hypothetical protein
MAHLLDKYKIEKVDGSPVDPNAMYFVLRIDTDYHARVALRAYARSTRASDPEFANELDAWIESRPPITSSELISGFPKPEMNQYLDYLDIVRESGVTNMFGATPYLMVEYDLEHDEARAILVFWMETFSQRHPPKEA